MPTTTTTTTTTVNVTITGNVIETVTTTVITARTIDIKAPDPAPLPPAAAAAPGPVAPAPVPPAAAPAPAPGRRQAGERCRASRVLRAAERDRTGYGIPRDTATPTIRNEFMKLRIQEGIETRTDLDGWCGGPREIKILYMYLKDASPNHWYSLEHRESAQSLVRKIVLKELGRKIR